MGINTRRGAGDGGYALVAALVGATAFAYIAFQVLAADRGAVAAVAGRIEQARLTAAADAGVNLAIHGLAAQDRAARWSIDGRTRRLEFDGIEVSVTVEDERGKLALSLLSDGQSRALFARGGAKGERLDALVAEFRDWETDERADAGAILPLPASAAGAILRHGPFVTIQELAALPDMTPSIYARIAPFVTIYSDNNGAFAPKHALPFVLAVRKADPVEASDQDSGQPDINQQTPDEEVGDDLLVGHTLTIRAVAKGPGGALANRAETLQLTGDSARPVWVRSVE